MAIHLKPAIVLVHGGWHVPQHYSDFTQLLENEGFDVFCPLLPTCDEEKNRNTDLSDDVAVIRDQVVTLTRQSREIIMLLHSYGGVVGTEAVKGLTVKDQAKEGPSSGVVHLIYMCAFMLQVGESVGSASLPRPDPEPVEFDEVTGTNFLCEDPVRLFYADVDPELAAKMTRLLTRQSAKAHMDKLTYPAWRDVSVTYLRTEDDQVLFPEWQQKQIEAVRKTGVNLEVQTYKSSHSPFLSLPKEMVAAVKKVADRDGYSVG